MNDKNFRAPAPVNTRAVDALALGYPRRIATKKQATDTTSAAAHHKEET